MANRPLLRLFGVRAEVEGALGRLEKSMGELREDLDVALEAFVAKNQRGARFAPDALPAARLPPLEPSSSGAFDLTSTCVCLAPSGGASTIDLDAEFWARVKDRHELAEGRLVAAFDCRADWDHWEMQPHGDELLVLLEGRVTLVLETTDGDVRVVLDRGRACIVPRGTWHRAVVELPGKLLAITDGRGSEHRPL